MWGTIEMQNYLLKPIKIGNRFSENRIVVNSVECCDSDSKGNPGEKTYERYSKYFEGGSGIVILESLTITDESRSTKYQLSLLPENEKALTVFVSKMKKINPKTLFFFQLSHSGELSNTDFSKRVCVKPLPGFGGKLLDKDSIEKIIDLFIRAAKIAHASGADGIDLKLCHGYLPSQFIRPYNDRKWKFGGTWKNRTRFPYTIYEKLQRAINDPDFIIGSKISIWEGFPGGFGSAGPDTAIIDLTEPLDLVKGLEERGAKFILVSAGSVAASSPISQPDKKVPESVYLHFNAQKIVKDTVKNDTVVIGSAYSILNNGGYLRAVKKTESSLIYWGNKNIKDGVTDMIALGRQSLADSFIPVKIKSGKEDYINWCIFCGQCSKLLDNQVNTGCTVYNKEYADALKQLRKYKIQ